MDTHYSPCAVDFVRKADVVSNRRTELSPLGVFHPAARVIRKCIAEANMRTVFVIAGIFTLATALGPNAALAQHGGSAMHAAGSASALANSRAHIDGTKSLARADEVAGTHGLKGRTIARTRGAKKTGFCPPGQAKKPGSGSRFQC
jgi:hypothetical protein